MDTFSHSTTLPASGSAPYYQDEQVTLYHGDCRELVETWRTADVLVTDPPYGMSYKSGWNDASEIDGDNDTTLRDYVLACWLQRPALVFGRWSVKRPPHTRVVLTWDKGEWPGMGDLMLPWGPSTEEIYVLGQGFVGKRAGTVLRFNRKPASSVAHPTPKPVALMETLLLACPPEWVIADPFSGSGTTLLAAKNLGRRAIGIEKDERYCELAASRLAQDVLFGGVA